MITIYWIKINNYKCNSCYKGLKQKKKLFILKCDFFHSQKKSIDSQHYSVYFLLKIANNKDLFELLYEVQEDTDHKLARF